ncbi:MAG: class I SAM-dependent methyltransferase [Bryobacteraceae bacterium]
MRVKKIVRNNEYDPFAQFYNRHWGADYRAEAFPVVERLLLARLKPGAALLDVCCGTGQFTGTVHRLGYHMAGLDASAEMIGYARRNAPGVPFTVADVRDFSLRRKFDGAWSIFESLNHVPDMPGLAQAFGRVRRHLKPGAAFLFDLNREDAFILYWNTTDAVVESDSVCVLRMEYDQQTRTGTCNAVGFSKAGKAWTRVDFTVRQTYHDHDAVEDALRQAGFRDVTLYDARDAGMTGAAGYARTFFLATA